jgi:hypothetical protein
LADSPAGATLLAQRIGPLNQEIDRMRCRHWMVLLTFLGLALLGCKGSDGPEEDPAQTGTQAQAGQQPSATPSGRAPLGDTSEPAKAVAVFLDAVCQGDDERILEMYTVRARQEATRLEESFAPKASDTAEFEVGQVEYLAEDGARVACTWTDLAADGKPSTRKLLWMVRREPAGWRVAGTAIYPFPGENPVLFDFENLKEAIRKRQLLETELLRRAQRESLQAQQPGIPADSVRR